MHTQEDLSGLSFRKEGAEGLGGGARVPGAPGVPHSVRGGHG